MALIEDYALIGDTHSAALVSKDGSIDWLCLPRFDSGACFAAILDPDKGGHWRIRPKGDITSVHRSYRDGSLVLETSFETAGGIVTLVDCLPIEGSSDVDDPRKVVPEEVIARIVYGRRGRVAMTMEYMPRFDYGHILPWFRLHIDDGALEAVGGPDALDLRSPVDLQVSDGAAHAEFEVGEGDAVRFIAAYHPGHLKPRHSWGPDDCDELIANTDRFWRSWIQRCNYDGPYREEVFRSLLTLKALTYSPTGGIVAAPTASLPEAIGGVRNWDYRYCWLRDATFMLMVLLDQGFGSEAKEWRDWLLRAVAGDPQDLQIMYGVMGERRLPELEVEWLAGYEDSRPVRIGNAAVDQFQLDVYGEVMDALHSSRRAGIHPSAVAWELQRNIVEFVCDHWRDPDEGIWEVRSGRKHFVHSKVMAWVAVDRAVSAAERYNLPGPVDRWKTERSAIRDEVLERGVSAANGCFMRAYDDDELDASLLMLPLVGFIDATDDRMRQTIEAIEAQLLEDGFVMRYRPEVADDGLPPGEGAFLMCTFWLVNCLVLLGREAEADALFQRLLGVANDVGLLSEQYDAERGRLVGNFPQAFSHTALVASAMALLTSGDTPIIDRKR